MRTTRCAREHIEGQTIVLDRRFAKGGTTIVGGKVVRAISSSSATVARALHREPVRPNDCPRGERGAVEATGPRTHGLLPHSSIMTFVVVPVADGYMSIVVAA